MHRFLVLIAIIVLSASAYAQEAFAVDSIHDVAMPRDEIFNNAALWLAESTRSSKSVIELKDKELGTIIGNAAADLRINFLTVIPIEFKLRIDVKENKYRMTFSQVRLLTESGFKPIEQANRESLEPIARDTFDKLIASFGAYLATAPKNKSW